MILVNLIFISNSVNLEAESESKIHSIAKILSTHDTVKVKIITHSDCRGSDDYNLRLSNRRATNIVKILTSEGVNPNNLTSEGKGESEPIIACDCDNPNETCSEKELKINRRVEFKIGFD